MKYFFRLPVIPPPQAKGASVLSPKEGFEGPILLGNGEIDLLCGNCIATIAEGMQPEQIKNIVLQCPRCRSYNAIASIPALTHFIQELQSLPAHDKKLEKLSQILTEAKSKNSTKNEVLQTIEQNLPELSSVKALLIPDSSGDFYSMMSFLMALLIWLSSRYNKKEHPKTIVNNYFTENSPFADASDDQACPCGSGLTFKNCHGK